MVMKDFTPMTKKCVFYLTGLSYSPTHKHTQTVADEQLFILILNEVRANKLQ